MEEMTSLWSYQESIDELKQKIHETELELEAVKSIRNDEMNINTNSLKQLLQLLKLVHQERDETRDQIQKLLMSSSIINPSIPYSSINAESNSLSDTYNHMNSSPDFSNINNTNNNFFVQDHYRPEMMLSSNGFQAFRSVPEIDHATLMMDSMIRGKTLPQKGNLLQAVIKAGPLLQTLLLANPISSFQNLSPISCGSFSDMTGGGGSSGGGGFSFDDVNFSNYQGRMVAKRQRFR